MLTDDDKPLVKDFLSRLGDNPDREGLSETPARMISAWNHWCSGYYQDPADVLKTFEDGSANYDQMICQVNIPVYSLCEHHLAPFFGVAHMAYIPAGKVVGLSKMSRLVNVFARRLQVQERLTTQIAHAFNEHVKPRGVGVVLCCRHLCMESRGVQNTGTATTTSALLGDFMDDQAARAEFLNFVKMADGKHV